MTTLPLPALLEEVFLIMNRRLFGTGGNMSRHPSQIQPGDPDSVIKELWKSDLNLAVEMTIRNSFPLGLLGFEVAEKAAERNGTVELFEAKLNALRAKVKQQLILENPALAAQA